MASVNPPIRRTLPFQQSLNSGSRLSNRAACRNPTTESVQVGTRPDPDPSRDIPFLQRPKPGHTCHDTITEDAACFSQPHTDETMNTPAVWNCVDWKERLVWTVGLTIALCILFADVLLDLIVRWSGEPQYVHGFVVAPIAVGLAWMRRREVPLGAARTHLGGLMLIVFAVMLGINARYFDLDIADYAGLLTGMTGILLLVWGRRLTAAWYPSIGFLVFMFPLPLRIEQMLSGPLQLWGAQEAAWYIQMLGIPAYALGGTIHMSEHQLGIADAFSGIRMFMVFVAISVATIMTSQRTRWEKLLILFSAIPVSLICNTVRIVVAAALFQWVGTGTASLITGDLSGWLIIVAAIPLVYLELRLLDWLVVEVRDPLARVSASRQAPGIIPVVTSAKYSRPGQQGIST